MTAKQSAYNLLIVIMITWHTYLVVGILLLSGCSEQSPSSKERNRYQNFKDKEKSMSAEAITRKQRSIAILRSESVPVIEHLPVISTVEESKRRTTEEVVERAMALAMVAAKAEGLEKSILDDWINRLNLKGKFTPQEQRFIDNQHISEHERVQMIWRYECYWVMIWALGMVDSLHRPDTICDVQYAVSLLINNIENDFKSKAKLRPQDEILDAADLIYRYHWACVDANLQNHEMPAGLSVDVVMERHHALNWLIGYMNQEWDDVTTDT